MNRPNPSHPRAALLGVAVFILAAFCAGALAQSGRKAQKPLGLPTEQPTPTPTPAESESESKPAETKKQGALVTFIVVKDDSLTLGIDPWAREGTATAFVERLKQAGRDVEVKDGGKGTRHDARDRARKEETAYVVHFQLDEDTYTGTSSDPRGLVLRTFVYAPKTGDLKFSDTVYQRPYYDTARVGGVGVPVPSRRVERYPSQHQLEQGARDAADRLLSRFQIRAPER